jgi:hypothetical protein
MGNGAHKEGHQPKAGHPGNPVLLKIVKSFFHKAGCHHSLTTVFQMDQPVYVKRLLL